jgi:hypothetical protein
MRTGHLPGGNAGLSRKGWAAFCGKRILYLPVGLELKGGSWPLETNSIL